MEENSIKVLTGLDAIKKRPDMYLPNYRRDGVRQFVMVVADNFFSPQRPSFKFSVEVFKSDRCIFIQLDNIPDVSSTPHPETQRLAIESMLQELQACACGEKLFPVPYGLGMGLCVVNALCSKVIWEDSNVRLEYQDGVQVSKEISVSKHPGRAYLTLFPNPDITFEGI